MPQKLDIQPLDIQPVDSKELDIQPLDIQSITSTSSSEPGNIDLYKQPKIKNPKGGISTVYSRSFNLDGKETLLPSVTPEGKFLETDDNIINEYRRTGKHLGKFSTVDEANKYAEQLHKDYESGKYDKHEPSMLSKALDTISEPLTDAPSRFANTVSQYMTDPNQQIMQETGQGGMHDYFANTLAKLRGFEAGAVEGVGNLASSLTSPINLATTALTGGSSMAAKAGLPAIARGLLLGAKGAGLLTAGHGASNVISPESTMGERGQGLVEIAGGITGMTHAPSTSTKSGFFEQVKPSKIAEKAEVSIKPERSIAADVKKPNILVATPTKEQLAQLTSKGYTFDGLNDEGKFRFKHAGASEKVLKDLETTKSSEPIIRKLANKPERETGPIREAWNLSRGLMSVDLPFVTSAGFRQGLPLIGTRNWFKAWMPSAKSYGSQAFYTSHKALLEADPLMQRQTVPVMKVDGTQLMKGNQPVMRETPSIAEKAGVSFTDLNHLTSREESIRSSLAERIPVYGKIVGASNRAYTSYINDLRLNAFRNMYEAMPDKNNMVALKELGDAVNTFTGRGPLRTGVPFTGKELNAEKYAGGLSEILFAPKLIASRLQMMNPINYTMTQPQVRKEYLKAALRTAGAWTTLAGLASMTGAGEVNLQPTSADFGKIRIGDTRLDPAGGFQQFLVLASRLASNKFTSTTTGETYDLGKGFGAMTRGSTLQDFLANKLHPSLRYFYDAAFAKEGRPFQVLDRAIQLAIPMLSKDLLEIAQETPELLPGLAVLTSAGMGTQHYSEGGFNSPMIIPEESDIVLGQ